MSRVLKKHWKMLYYLLDLNFCMYFYRVLFLQEWQNNFDTSDEWITVVIGGGYEMHLGLVFDRQGLQVQIPEFDINTCRIAMPADAFPPDENIYSIITL